MIICWQNNNRLSQRIYCRSLLRMKLLSFDNHMLYRLFSPYSVLENWSVWVSRLLSACHMLDAWSMGDKAVRQEDGRRFNQATRSPGPPSSLLCVPVITSFSLLQSWYLSYHLALGTCRAYQYPLVSSLSILWPHLGK